MTHPSARVIASVSAVQDAQPNLVPPDVYHGHLPYRRAASAFAMATAASTARPIIFVHAGQPMMAAIKERLLHDSTESMSWYGNTIVSGRCCARDAR